MKDIASMRTFSVRTVPCRKVTVQTWCSSWQCSSTSWRSMATAKRLVKASYRSPVAGSYSFSPATAQLPRSPLRPREGSSVALSSVREFECMVARLWVTRLSSSAVMEGLDTASASRRSACARSCAAASAHSFVTNWQAPSTEVTLRRMFIACSSVLAGLSAVLAFGFRLVSTAGRAGTASCFFGTGTGAGSRRRSRRRWNVAGPAASAASVASAGSAAAEASPAASSEGAESAAAGPSAAAASEVSSAGASSAVSAGAGPEAGASALEPPTSLSTPSWCSAPVIASPTSSEAVLRVGSASSSSAGAAGSAVSVAAGVAAAACWGRKV
mmetsp:Transcript_35388/g.77288  ORF Transcript_35388/g.77288 Transcript_35388/m.77288 type:complete len:328 (+) Transcript_35388:749-1732(+)